MRDWFSFGHFQILEENGRYMERLVYMDYNATTPVHPEVLEEMLPFLRADFGNPSSIHWAGRTAKRAVELARERVAALLNCDTAEVAFTSCATESNNAALKGVAAALRGRGDHIVTTRVEHPSVMYPCLFLENLGYRVTSLDVNAEGMLDLDELESAITKKTILISVMYANNETGTVQPVAEFAAAAKRVGAWFHSDAVQAFGKRPVDFRALNGAGVNALTLSAHKIGGPQGAGALVVDKRVELQPLIAGGGHERGLRSGTENVAAIVGFGLAAELATARLDERAARLLALREELEMALTALGATIFGARVERLPNTTYFAFPAIDGETLVGKLDRAGFAVAAGAACSSANPEPSHVLLAMGVEPQLARGAVRVSLGADNTSAQVRDFVAALNSTLSQLRGMMALAG